MQQQLRQRAQARAGARVGAQRRARVVHVRAAAASPALRSPMLSNLQNGLVLKPGRGTLDMLDEERGVCSIASPYSPEYVRSRVMATPAEAAVVGLRALNIVGRLGTYFSCLWWDRVTGAEDTPARVRLRASQLRDMLTALGPSFIKAGQVLANRPDIVREDYMNELCVLQDDVPPFPDEVAFATIERDLGRPLGEVFSSISERPVAAASLGQVYKAVLRDTGEEVAIKVQRPGVEPVILRDLVIFRALGAAVNTLARRRLGCNAELIVDEFGEKLLEELDYKQEARNIEEFGRNFASDPTVKIPWVRRDLCSRQVIVMEWIDGIRCTDVAGIMSSGVDVDNFIKVGVVSGLRQLLEFGLFHGDPHPGNIFCLRDGRIAYVDFGNVAQLSNANKQVLVDAVVHAVNEDYEEMAGDFIKLGFLTPGTDITPIVPALENIWRDSRGQSLADFNFRTVTSKFNELVYQYPIRIPERYSLVIRSLLTQEGICLTLKPQFHFLEVAYPYVARRLLTDADPALRDRLIQVLFQGGKFQWARLANLITLARDGTGGAAAAAAVAAAGLGAAPAAGAGGGLDLSETVRDAVRLVMTDAKLRGQLIEALTEGNKLHVDEVAALVGMLGPAGVDPSRLVGQVVADLPALSRSVMLSWADRVLVS
ncbi:MAG: ABC1 family-domain-containing protein [Monoraphidium minutum]|nr:MAG: ABC1 family-domain-containing protein [Monoraphidium minutum]